MYPESRPSQTQYMYIFTGEIARLNCGIRPGRARSLYSAEWNRNNQFVNTTFSLSVPVQNLSQNGTVYQCIVTVQGCSPGCTPRILEGDSITLVVGGKYILTNRFRLATSWMRQMLLNLVGPVWGALFPLVVFCLFFCIHLVALYSLMIAEFQLPFI